MDPVVSEIATKVASYVVIAGLGSVQTCLIWSARVIRKAKKDLNNAHIKIRALEQRLQCLERALYYQGDSDHASISDRDT